MLHRIVRAAGLLLFATSTTPAAAGGFKDHVVFTFNARIRGELCDYFEPGAPVPPGAARYGFGAAQLRAGVRATFPHVQLVAEVQDTRLFGLPTDASLAPPFGNLGPGAIYFAHGRQRNQGETFIKQAVVTLRRSGFSAALGRFEYADGLETLPADASLAWLKRSRIAERLIGPFGYTHVSRSFDGARLSYDRAGWNATAFAMHPTRGGYDVRANRELDDIDLAGAAFSLKPTLAAGAADLRLSYLYYDDGRGEALKVDNRPQSVRLADPRPIRVHGVGGHAATVLATSSGSADLMLWAAAQTGDWGSLEHRAWAIAAEGGWQFTRLPGAPWLRVGYDRSSGDDDAADGDHGTFFQVMPTARIYAQFPFFNLMNSEDVFAQVLLKPHALVQVRSDFHWLKLGNVRDLWYSGGGATNDQIFGFSGIPSGGRRSLARLGDVSMSVPIHPKLLVYAYYAHAFGRDVVAASFARSNADYGYLELTFRY